MRILLVEDDPNLRRLWRKSLSGEGSRITECDTLEAAAEALRRYPHDLVLLDLYMGREACLSLAGEIRARNPDCRILLIAGSADGAVEAAEQVCGNGDMVLRRPVDIERFLSLCLPLIDRQGPGAAVGN